MASRKELKKDIDYFVFDLISECYECISENPEMDMSGYEKIINDVIELQDQLLIRINQFDAKSGENSKKYFQAIKKDLAEGLKKGYQDLEVLDKKTA